MELLIGVPLLIAAVTGVVEFVKRAVNFEWKVCLIIIAAAITGYILAPEVGAEITRIQGLVIGFGASGVVTIFQNNGKNTPRPENG